MGQAPPGIKVEHMITAKQPINGVTAVRRQWRDHNEIACAQAVFFAIALAARLPLKNRPNRELRMVMTFIVQLTTPGAAQLQPGKLFITPE
ncbi:hypothetical protein CIT292_09267 [Citrobacter youngae ATCC 29220]|uniref:Uncharacterized protein n=1 Tax=Citrobacter youngae ATCC 29220 TaxID=500640 RepID=D4BEQ4_9ENTR|nr:hypothetical protein CIT292_09267 [Citrobacter youngae ATCC 29220]